MYQNRKDAGFVGIIVTIVLAFVAVGSAVLVVDTNNSKKAKILATDINEMEIQNGSIRDDDSSKVPSILNIVKNQPASIKTKPSGNSIALNLKTFNSSKIKSEQFDFYEFNYPSGWYVAYADDMTVYLSTDETVKSKELFSSKILKGNKPFIEVNNSGGAYTEEYMQENFKTKIINQKNVSWKTEYWSNQKITLFQYLFSTPYANKEHVSVKIGPVDTVNSDTYRTFVEQIVGSYKVVEGPKGIESRRSKAEQIFLLDEAETNPQKSELRKKDNLLMLENSSIKGNSLIYIRDNGSITGFCEEVNFANRLNEYRQISPGPVRCVSNANSYLVTIKLNLGNYVCADATDSTERPVYAPLYIPKVKTLTEAEYKNVTTRTILSCK